mmetsp:Transcript_6780/g.21889  ORF Transcript_6780/g.21889 Transcript_6780/m.21889 type:complete len:202 (-) Transcript_6780:276-881(-)
MDPSPAQAMASTESVWPVSEATTAPVRAFQILIEASFEALAKSSADLGMSTPSTWRGAHASAVIHLVCRASTKMHRPVLGSQTRTSPFLSPDANLEQSGAHAVHSTWLRWPAHVFFGVADSASQNRTVASPPPEASILPSGEYVTCRMASVWPGIVSAQRLTRRTRKTARGSYVTHKTCSVETLWSSRYCVTLVSSAPPSA